MDTRPNDYEQPAPEEPIVIGPMAAPEPAAPMAPEPTPASEPMPAAPASVAAPAPEPAPAAAVPEPMFAPGPAAAAAPATPATQPLPVATPIPEPAAASYTTASGYTTTPQTTVPPIQGPSATVAIPVAPAPAAPAAGAPAAGAVAMPAPARSEAKKSSKPKGWGAVILAAVIAALVGALVAVGITLLVMNHTGGLTTAGVSTNTNTGSSITVKGDAANLSEVVAQKALPSVVSITVSASTQSNPFSNSTTESEQDSGSGVIIKSNGYIITNNHVIAGGNKIVVNAGGKNYTAKVVGADTGTDIAVLKIDATNLPAISIGSSSDLAVGQYVMAIGCPFGLEKSVSTGVISGLGRSDLMTTQTYVTAYTDLIQTDAAINPGNSGGALVDQNGRLIGINALINSTSGSSAGVGFAIPVSTAIDIANQIMTTGKVVHPFLGVSTQTVTSDVASAYNMPVSEGAYVVSVSSGSPAASAGIKADDIITQINGTKITSSDDVFTAVRSYKIGDTITITFYRGTKQMSVKAKLVSDAANQAQQQQQEEELQQQQQNGTNGSLDGGSGSSGSSGSGSGSSTDPHSGYTQQQLQDLLNQLQGGSGTGN